MVDALSHTDTRPTFGLPKGVTLEDQKVAREAIRDLMMFNNAVQSEMQRMRHSAASGNQIDSILFEKMLRVQNSYDYAMTGFKAFDDEMERAALLTLSDAIEDLLHFINDRSH